MFSKEKVVGVISVLVLNPEHWFISMETWPTQDRYTEQHSLRSDEDCWKGRCFWGIGGGQVSVVYELAWLSDRGEGVEERRWTAALRLWNGGVWCREEQHLCPINQSHQNHIITTFSDTLIILLHMGKKNKSRVGEESEKALSPQFLCLLLSPTQNY